MLTPRATPRLVVEDFGVEAGGPARAVLVEAGADDAGVARLVVRLQAGIHRPRVGVLAFLLVDEREHFVGHGPAVVVVAALEQEHGVQRLGGRLALAHAGGHGFAGGLGGRGGVAPAEPAGDERDQPGQEELAAAPRAWSNCCVHE